MLYQYGTITYDLGGLPRSLHDRIGEEDVTDALHDYLDAYMTDKDAYDEYVGRPSEPLLHAYTLARKHRKKMWSSLILLLDDDSDEE